MKQRLSNAWAWLRAWRASRWFALAFAANFIPAAISWSQRVYEFFAAGPQSGEQFPGLSTLGYAAGAATVAALMGALGLVTDLVAKSGHVPLKESKP